MPKRTDTRERMLATAADLFRTQGYHATGLNQLLSAGGAPKGSLYFHFPGGKEQLAVEALERSGGELRDLLRRELTPEIPAADGISLVLRGLGQALADSDFKRGCPLATVAMDAGDNEPIRVACADGYGSWQEVIEEFLTTRGIAAERAKPLATVVLSVIEGALLLSRTQRDLGPLHAAETHLRQTIEWELSR